MSVLLFTKRMGTVLQKLKKSGIEDENGKLVKFKGRLTDDGITSLNVWGCHPKQQR